MDELQMLGTLLAKPDPSQDTVDQGRHRLQNAMRGGQVRRRKAGWLAGGLGLTAAAATAAIVIASGSTAPAPTPNSPPKAVQQTPRQILLAAATTAARTPAGSGTYWWVKMVSWDSQAKELSQDEHWYRHDGQTWRRWWKSEGKVVKAFGRRPFYLGFAEVSFEQMQKLPTKPDALKAWVADANKRSNARTPAGRPTAAERKEEVFQGLVSLITTQPAPPKVRAAAFRAIAAYPNVKSIGAVEGGQGLVFTVALMGQARLVVDPVTAQVRSTNFIPLGGAMMGGPHKITTGWTNVLPK